MARKFFARRLGIVSLCLGVLLSVCGGVSLFQKTTANATGFETIEPTSLITADSAAIVSYDGGVKVSSEVAYGGQIDYTFSGDTTLEFNFAEPHGGGYYGNFVFRVADALDERNYFDVEYSVTHTYNSNAGEAIGYTGAYVKYGEEIRSSSYSGNTWYNEYKTGNAASNAANFAPSMTTFRAQTGILELGYDTNGNFSVSVNQYNTDIMRTISAFDGTNAFESGETWGLPEMPFENGYTISFSSEFESTKTTDKATDVLFKSIENGGSTYTLTGKTNTEEISIEARENYEDLRVGKSVVIPAATYGDDIAVENVQVIQPNGEEKEVSANETYEIAQAGVHTVVYTTSAGSVAAFSFDVAEYFATTDFVYTQATVSQTTEGLKVVSETPYKGGLKGVFKGDTTLKFIFAQPHEGWFAGNFVFRITDALDERNYFDVEYRVLNTWTSDTYGAIGYTGAYVKYGEEIRSAQYSGTAWYNSYQTSGETANFAPAFTTLPTRPQVGILKLGYDANGDFSVSVNRYDADTMKTIAVFDGEETFVSGSTWGLPEMPFADGYTISFSSEFESTKTTDKATDVCFKSIEHSTATYDFTTSVELEKDSVIKGFEKSFEILTDVEAPAGKVFLGYRSKKDNKLYSSATLVRKNDVETFEPVLISFDTLKGASVRIDTSENAQSGIRFITVFNEDEYQQISSYISSMGTLVMYTDTLNNAGKEFLPENFVLGQTIHQVQNSKGTYEYVDEQTQTSYAYSMAIVGIQDYTKKFSARAYLVVSYADGSTKTVYSDYNATDDSRSIAQVAHTLRTTDQAAYNKMSDAQRAIIDGYADAYQG